MHSSVAESLNAVSQATNENESPRTSNTTEAGTNKLEGDMEYFRQKITIAQELGNKAEEAMTLKDFGICLGNGGRPKDATECDLRSLKLYQELNDKVNEQVLCRNLGVNYRNTGQYETALAWSHKSLKMAQELGNKVQEAMTLQGIGVCFENAGKPKEAIEYDLRSLKLYQELNYKVKEQEVCRNLGVHYRLTWQYETALKCYYKSLKMAQELGNKDEEAETLQDIGICLWHDCKPKESIEYELRSLKLYRELNDRVKEQVLCRNLGVMYKLTCQYETAIVYYKKALLIANELEIKEKQHELHLDLEVIYHKIGETASALECYKKAVLIAPPLRDEDRNRLTLVKNAEHPFHNMTEVTDDRASQANETWPEENNYQVSSKFSNTMVRDLDYLIKHEICMELDVERRLGGDFKELAARMGYPANKINLLSQYKSPTQELLLHWEVKNEATVKKLRELLRLMERDDVLRILDKAFETGQSECFGCGGKRLYSGEEENIAAKKTKCKPFLNLMLIFPTNFVKKIKKRKWITAYSEKTISNNQQMLS